MRWLDAAARLRREREPAVLVTLISARGHAPRAAGAKMVVSATATYDSIGGGNLEETAIRRARAMIGEGARLPEQLELGLSDKARNDFGMQCCGGQVFVLLEPLPAVPAVAIFGMGHVGLELARILARHDLELHLVDSRQDELAPQRLSVLDDANATVHPHHSPVPELVLGELPRGSHVLIMTHDHAEDIALVDAALRCGHLGSIGLIGSSAKWTRFRRRLIQEGHTEAELARVRTPIGLAGLTGKQPATIAVGVAADLLLSFQAEHADSRVRS